MNFSPDFKRYFEKSGVRVDARHVPQGIVVLNNVPVSPTLVNKPRTNLCVALDAARGIIVWVDADLRPLSAESPASAILSGRTKENWQLVAHAQPFTSHEDAIAATIEMLGGQPPCGPERGPQPDAPLGGRFLPTVARVVDPGEIERNLVGRERLLDVAERLVRGDPRALVFAGESGAGMTSCAIETLCRTVQRRPARAVRIDCALVPTDMVFPASSDERFRQLLADCLAIVQPETWFLFDNVQWPLRTGTLAQCALATALERGLRCVCTCQTDVFAPSRLLPMLARRLHWLPLPPLEPEDVQEVVRQRADVLSHDRGISIDEAALAAVLDRRSAVLGADPARALNALEAAVALVEEGGVVGPDEVFAAVGVSTAE